MFLSDFSAIIRILSVFLVMFLLIRQKINISGVFFSGALLLALFFQMRPSSLIYSLFFGFFSEKTLMLASIVSLITIFGTLLEISGTNRRMADHFNSTEIGKRLGLAIFPAIIGLLPVPGGAVFSAPMVKNLSEIHEIGPSRMSLINYWFRHVWEYFWPLYPGIILASSISGMGLDQIAYRMFPFSLIALGLGVFFLPGTSFGQTIYRNLSETGKLAEANEKGLISKTFKEMTPIFLVVAPVIVLPPLLSVYFGNGMIQRDILLIISLLAGIMYIVIKNSLEPESVRATIMNKKMADMILMVVSIMIFKKILEDTGAAERMAFEIRDTGIPIYLTAFFLPFLTGMVTGISVAFIGISFPVVVSIAASMPDPGAGYAATCLAIVSGFMGVMLSPLHLCMILSNSFFKADHAVFYKKLIVPCSLIAICGFIHYHLTLSLK